jgi:hypothetical protein
MLERGNDCSINGAQRHDRLLTQSSGNGDDKFPGNHSKKWWSVYRCSMRKVFDHVTQSNEGREGPANDKRTSGNKCSWTLRASNT